MSWLGWKSQVQCPNHYTTKPFVDDLLALTTESQKSNIVTKLSRNIKFVEDVQR